MTVPGVDRVMYARACPFCGGPVDADATDSVALSVRDAVGAVAMFTAHRRCLEGVMHAGSRDVLPPGPPDPGSR